MRDLSFLNSRIQESEDLILTAIHQHGGVVEKSKRMFQLLDNPLKLEKELF